jgi:hypothetical protein
MRGVWNEEAFIASKQIILCESLIDALTFWCAGFRHVTTSYGINGFTDEHRAALQKHDTERVYIAYDHDEAGTRHPPHASCRSVSWIRPVATRELPAGPACLSTHSARLVATEDGRANGCRFSHSAGLGIR